MTLGERQLLSNALNSSPGSGVLMRYAQSGTVAAHVTDQLTHAVRSQKRAVADCLTCDMEFTEATYKTDVIREASVADGGLIDSHRDPTTAEVCGPVQRRHRGSTK